MKKIIVFLLSICLVVPNIYTVNAKGDKITNEEKEPVIKQCNLYDCLDTVQYADIKNGVDFVIVEGFLTFICYGSEYEYNNQIHLVTTGIQIRPYNDGRDFIHLDLNH